jgi:hypothetical protein
MKAVSLSCVNHSQFIILPLLMCVQRQETRDSFVTLQYSVPTVGTAPLQLAVQLNLDLTATSNVDLYSQALLDSTTVSEPAIMLLCTVGVF